MFIQNKNIDVVGSGVAKQSSSISWALVYCKYKTVTDLRHKRFFFFFLWFISCKRSFFFFFCELLQFSPCLWVSMKCSEERNSTLDYCTTCFRDLSPLVWLHIIHFETSQYADTLRLLDCVGSISVPVGFLNWGIECPLSVTLSVGTVFKDAHVDLLRSEYLTCQVPLSSWDYHVFKMPFIATYCLVKKKSPTA